LYDLWDLYADTLFPLTATTVVALAVMPLVGLVRPAVRSHPRFRSALKWLGVAFGAEVVLIGIYVVYLFASPWPRMDEF
jgi:hypothetical protein